jgi:hypothetical protein
MTTDEDAIRCDLSAIPAGERFRHFALARRVLFANDRAVREVENGLVFELPPDRLLDIARFVENERRCCRHLAFTLEIPPRNAALILRVVGPGAREELRSLDNSSREKTMSRFCLPRVSVWPVAGGLTVLSVAAWLATTGVWRGWTLGGVSLPAVFVCVLPCTIPVIAARWLTRRGRGPSSASTIR